MLVAQIGAPITAINIIDGKFSYEAQLVMQLDEKMSAEHALIIKKISGDYNQLAEKISQLDEKMSANHAHLIEIMSANNAQLVEKLCANSAQLNSMKESFLILEF